MGLTNRRRLTRAVIVLLVLVAGAAAWDLWRLVQAQRLNALIEAGAPDAADDPLAPPPLRFAQAWALAASGATEAALNRYGALHGDSPLGRAARYNSGNLLLRQATAMRAGAAAQAGQALALVELAKEAYREVLRQDPQDWDARYNLERAQRLVPEPDAADDAPPAPPRGAERAATTMRGYSPGLP